MPWVIALGADALPELMDLAIWIVVLAGSLLMYAMTRWLFNGFIAVVGTFPVVGGRMQAAVIGVRDLLTSYAAQHEVVLLSGFQNAGRDLVNLLHRLLWPIFADIGARLFQVEQNVRLLNIEVADQALPALADQAGRLLRVEENVRQLNAQGGQTLASFEADVQARLFQVEDNVRQLNTAVQTDLPAQLRQLGADLAAIEAVVNRWQGLWPLLIPLANWEAGVQRDLEALRGATTAQDARLGQLERYRALLALLAVLGLLSVSQVAELARTARCINVCERLGILDDLDDRVESLEIAGH